MLSVLLFAAFLAFSLKVEGLELSWEKIRAKLEQPLPKWMQEQIQEDLGPFYDSGVRAEFIDATVRNVYRLPSGGLATFVHYRIQNNTVHFETSCSTNDARITCVVEVLEEMAKHLCLPDVDFLVSLWDSYDNPLFLEKTQCPVFTICKQKGNRWGVLYPEFRFFPYRQRTFNGIHSTITRSPWKQKIDTAFWRGMTSGGYYSKYTWDLKPRSRLVFLSKQRPDLIDAAFTSPYDLEDEVKEWMKHYGLFQPWQYPTDNVKYKYLVSIDGNTFASNFWWQLLSNSVVLKSDSAFIEWFYKGVDAYVHYIPYALDLSDFEEKIIWARMHDGQVEHIAEEGRAFAKEHLSNEALIVYFYRLLLAYADLQRL
jgi:hypothetical protein